MKITNNTDRDMSNLTKTLESFVPYTQERLGYDKPFQLFFETDVENSKNIFGKTAYYDPATMNIHVYVDGRHDKDMLRSISHEIVHHHQNCRGDFDGAFEMGEGYAQKSPHLRNMEAEAYLLGNGFLVRDFEDNIKLGESILMEWEQNNKKVLNEQEVPLEKQKKEPRLPIQTSIDQIFDKDETKIIDKVKQKMQNLPIATQMKFLEQLIDKFGLNDALVKKASVLIKQAKQKLKSVSEEEIKNPGEYIDGAKAKAGVDDDGDGVPDGADKDPKDGAIKESIKDHIKSKNQTLSEQLMKKWFKKGDK